MINAYHHVMPNYQQLYMAYICAEHIYAIRLANHIRTHIRTFWICRPCINSVCTQLNRIPVFTPWVYLVQVQVQSRKTTFFLKKPLHILFGVWECASALLDTEDWQKWQFLLSHTTSKGGAFCHPCHLNFFPVSIITHNRPSWAADFCHFHFIPGRWISSQYIRVHVV